MKAPSIGPMRFKASSAVTALFLLVSAAFLYCFLFIPPFLPVAGNGTGDCYIFIAPGQRMYQGEVIYRDVFQYVPPGVSLVNFGMFKLFGLRLWIPDLLALLLGLGLVGLGVVISKKLMRPGLAFLPSAIFLVGLNAYLVDPTHHWYSLLAAVAAIAILLEQRSPARIAGAGFLCGLCACFNQTCGLAAIVGFVIYLWLESRWTHEERHALLKKEARLLICFLTTCLAVNGYFIWEAGPARYFWSTVVFVVKYFPKWSDSDTFLGALKSFFPTFSPLHLSYYESLAHWLFLVADIPVIFIVFFAYYWRNSHKQPWAYWERPMLVAIVGFFMFLSSAPAPDEVRMAGISLPAFILLGWLLNSPRKSARVLVTVLAALVFARAFTDAAEKRPRPVAVLTTPQGRLAFTDAESYREFAWIQRQTRPAQYLYWPADPTVYFYLDLRNPTPMQQIVNNGFTTQEQVSEVIRGLKEHPVRYIVWNAQLIDAIPSWENPSDNHLGPLWDYIRSYYKLVKVFSNSDQIWEKQPSGGA